jgi:hypothetical protein
MRTMTPDNTLQLLTRGGALPTSLRYDAPSGSSRSREVFCVAVPGVAESLGGLH